VHRAASAGVDHRSVEGISGAVSGRLGVSMGMLLGAFTVDAGRRPSGSDGRMRTAIARVAVVRTEVVRPNATLLLVELVLPERHREFTAKWADLDMLLFTGRGERTASQYRNSCGAAAFVSKDCLDRFAIQHAVICLAGVAVIMYAPGGH
jgi:hypothetical protein